MVYGYARLWRRFEGFIGQEEKHQRYTKSIIDNRWKKEVYKSTVYWKDSKQPFKYGIKKKNTAT